MRVSMIYMFFGLLCVGLFAGVASGLFGVGGGVVIVPLLVWFFGYSQLQASGTSLLALVLPLGALAGVYQYYRQGLIGMSDVKLGIAISIGLFFGGFIGAKIAPQVNLQLLKRGFAVLLLFSAIQLWFFDKK